MNKTLKKVLRGVLLAFLIICVVLVGYLIYFIGSYSRIGDKAIVPESGDHEHTMAVKTEYNLLSWNIGFGAYDDEYTFFMDGGKSSRAKNEQAVYENLGGMVGYLTELQKERALDLICFQEVDIGSTRSYQVDQAKYLKNNFSGYFSTFVQNYNSPYIAYPIFQPHGASKSGMLTLSHFNIASARRIELPIEKGFYKYLDLDRCISVNRIPLNNGKQLVLVNVHLSAYTSDGTIADEQVKIVTKFCSDEFRRGNYVICAGDFNKDLLGNSPEVFGVSGEQYTWAQPFKTQLLEGTGMSLIAPLGDGESAVASCRNADIPYEKGKSFLITVDGFIVSDNVTVVKSEVLDCEFENSDHNPVMLTFKLK